MHVSSCYPLFRMGAAERVIKYSALFGALVLFSRGRKKDIEYSAGFVRLPAFSHGRVLCSEGERKNVIFADTLLSAIERYHKEKSGAKV